MLSSRISSAEEDSDEGESTLPGDYQSWSGVVSRLTPRTPVTSRQSSVPSNSQSSSYPTPTTNLSTQPKLWPPDISPVRSHRSGHRRRRRTSTQEIIIEKRHHHHHRRRRDRSFEGNRIITIPLDNRPTFGMRGYPRQVLEIERVRCHRHRKHRSCCYEIEYDTSPPPLIPPQSNIIYTNALPPPYTLPTQPVSMASTNNYSSSWLSTLPNLTPKIIEDLPRQTVHLPPIYLPSNQAYWNTDFEKIIFPAEIVNPVDGTLSIIQASPTINNAETTFVQSPFVVPAEPPIINPPTTTQLPPTMLTAPSGPFMQQVQDLFQRISLSQSLPISLPYNQTAMQLPRPAIPQYNTVMNSFYNPQMIPTASRTNMAPYPPANIQPIVAQNSGPYNATTFTPVYSGNTLIYPPANITPYHSYINAQYNPVNKRAYESTSISPYSPANITPYTPLNSTTATEYQPMINNPIRSNPIHSESFLNIGTTSSPNASNIGPYAPANITPYRATADLSSNISISPPSIPTSSMPYTGLTSLTASTSFNSSSSALNERPVSAPHTSLPSTQTTYQPNIATPKSILRNGSSNHLSSTTYTRLNPSNVLSPNVITRELETVV